MYQLPRVRKDHSRHTARIRPTYADVLCGLLDEPDIGRFCWSRNWLRAGICAALALHPR